MICFSLTYLSILVINIDNAYAVFIYLMAAIIAYVTVQARWYDRKRSKAQMVCLVLLFAFVLGDVQMILQSVVSALGPARFSTVDLFGFFIGELPESFVAVALTYLFFNYVPDKIKTLTFNGFYYAEGTDQDKQDRFLRASRLSQRVSTLIMSEGVALGLAAVVFANALIPQMADDMIDTAEGFFWTDLMKVDWESLNNVIDDVSGTGTTEGTTDGTGNVDNAGNAKGTGTTEGTAGGTGNVDNAGNAEGTGATEGTADGTGNESVSSGTDDDRETSGDSDNKDDKKHRHPNNRFIMNASGLAFDVKLLMMILNVLIPLTVFANYYAHHRSPSSQLPWK